LKKGDYVNVSGQGGRYVIERKGSSLPDKPTPKPDEALPLLRDVLENHRLEIENGSTADDLVNWVREEQPNFDWKTYGFQEFTEFLNYAQDKLVVRVEPDEEKGLLVYLGAEFYPPALPTAPEPEMTPAEEEDEKQPIVEGQPTIFEPNPPPPKPKKAAPRKRAAAASGERSTTRRPRRKKTP
ncbi:MAG: OST-HTH/LOTUS domain-containing protein, partial [Bryobacteraceae bacterium]